MKLWDLLVLGSFSSFWLGRSFILLGWNAYNVFPLYHTHNLRRAIVVILVFSIQITQYSTAKCVSVRLYIIPICDRYNWMYKISAYIRSISTDNRNSRADEEAVPLFVEYIFRCNLRGHMVTIVRQHDAHKVQNEWKKQLRKNQPPNKMHQQCPAICHHIDRIRIWKGEKCIGSATLTR